MSDTAKTDKQLNLGAACFRCRGFRHACDRRKPACSRCHRRGINCVYPEAAPTLKRLQKATETLGDRIKKFSDRLKNGEPVTPFNDILVQTPSSTEDVRSPFAESVFSTYSEDMEEDDMMEEERPRRRARRGHGKVASTNNFSVYPCSKCFKDLQQCDLTLPKCSRCEANGFECGYKKTEPKANHVSQVLSTMNNVMDQWQISIDRMAKDFAQKTRDFSAKANSSLKIKPIPQTAWKITTTKKGLSVESNVNSYNDFSMLVDQFKRSMTISPRNRKNNIDSKNEAVTTPLDQNEDFNMNDILEPTTLEFDDTSSIHTTSGFAIWNLWAHPTHAMPQDYPIDISQELTDNLVELYCRTSCCSSIRLPIIDTADFLRRYRDPDPVKRPSTVLVFAVCAMAARNAFQLHVWSKRPSFDAPQYNMGKALSVAYCLRGRELLSECFDEPSFDNCQAAFLLSYCNYQNGYPGVIYFYEWIAYNMAMELGLYDANRDLTPYESMLIWCIYYFNAWYKALQGSDSGSSNGLSHCKPTSAIPTLMPLPSQDLSEDQDEADESLVQYYVWNSWVYLINLQILRDQSMAKIVSYQTNGKLDTGLPQDLLLMQETLKQFHQTLPVDWQSSNLETNVDQNCCSPSYAPSEQYKVNVKSFSQYCINLVSLHYSINQIILNQAFVPVDRIPCTTISIQSLETCLIAASNISQIFQLMVQQDKEECHVPLIGFLFANIIYRKLLSYTNDEHYQEIGRIGLLRSVDICKLSINYTYDFEMARTLVHLMEQDVQLILLQRGSNHYTSTSSSSSDGSSPYSSIPSPPSYVAVGQPMKEW